MKKIACIGVVTADVLTRYVDKLPPAGHLVYQEENSLFVGGCASNCAVSLHKLGLPVSLCCKLGDDSFGRFVLEELSQVGLDTKYIITDKDPSVSTSSSVVLINSGGERTFLHNPSSNATFRADEITSSQIDDADIVFVSGFNLMENFDGQPCADFLKLAQSKGKYTALDTAWDPTGRWMSRMKPCLPHLDLFMPSYEEAAEISGKTDLLEIAECFINLGVKNVVIKNGKHGCFIRTNSGETFSLPTYMDIKPVDTTGAGDSFSSGFLAGLAMDWDYRESGRLANAVGTHCIMETGATTGIKPLADVLEFMSKYDI